MPSNNLWVLPQTLIMLVPAVGIILTCLALRRLERATAWLVGLGCAILFTANLLWLLWVTGTIRLEQPAGSLLGKVSALAMQLLPVAEVIGLILVISAALRRKAPTGTPPAIVEVAGEGAGTDKDRARRPLLRRTVAVPVWTLTGAAVVIAGGVTAAAAVPTDDAVPRLVQGTVVSYSEEGPAIAFVEDGGDGQPRTYPLNSRFWVDRDGAQRTDDIPACLQPNISTPRRVELTFLDITGSRSHNFGNFPYLLSVHCLD